MKYFQGKLMHRLENENHQVYFVKYSLEVPKISLQFLKFADCCTPLLLVEELICAEVGIEFGCFRN